MRTNINSRVSKQNLLEKNRKELSAAEQRSKKWLNQRKMNTQKRTSLRNRIINNPRNRVSFAKIGSMYLYEYDPEDRSKKEMPYYDTFPCTLVFQLYSGGENGAGFYGLNLHWLPSSVRAYFLDILETDNKGKLAVLLDIVKDMAKIDIFKPAIHLYLYKNVLSDLTLIIPEEWENVINLPIARWKAGEGSRVKGTSNPSQNKVNADYHKNY